MQRSALYTILFATAVCIVCAIVVSSAAVSLKPAQDINAALEKQRNVLLAAGLLEAGEKVDAARGGSAPVREHPHGRRQSRDR